MSTNAGTLVSTRVLVYLQEKNISNFGCPTCVDAAVICKTIRGASKLCKILKGSLTGKRLRNSGLSYRKCSACLKGKVEPLTTI